MGRVISQKITLKTLCHDSKTALKKGAVKYFTFHTDFIPPPPPPPPPPPLQNGDADLDIFQDDTTTTEGRMPPSQPEDGNGNPLMHKDNDNGKTYQLCIGRGVSLICH